MGVRAYTESRAEANKRYDAKTYKDVNIALRIEDDADILASIQEARDEGVTLRQWLRGLFEGSQG